MEFEIEDDPQGLPDYPEGDRDGGLREDRMLVRFGLSRKMADRPDDACHEDTAATRLGEVA